MVEDLGQGDEWEAHAKAQKTARASDVRDSGHLLGLAKPLRVRLLDEDVDDGQIFSGVIVNLGLDFLGQSLVDEFIRPPAVPQPLVADFINDRRNLLQQRTQVGVFGGQGQSLMTLTGSAIVKEASRF